RRSVMPKSLAPKQKRSKAALNRLLAATARVIGKHGLEGATIALIAKEAGLSSIVVYRRFRDKSALLEAVFLHMMESQEKMLLQLTDEQLMRGVPLAEFARRTFKAMVIAYRERGRFLNAARRFAQTRGSAAFYRKVEAFEIRALQHAMRMMLERRDEISHPQ